MPRIVKNCCQNMPNTEYLFKILQNYKFCHFCKNLTARLQHRQNIKFVFNWNIFEKPRNWRHSLNIPKASFLHHLNISKEYNLFLGFVCDIFSISVQIMIYNCIPWFGLRSRINSNLYAILSGFLNLKLLTFGIC